MPTSGAVLAIGPQRQAGRVVTTMLLGLVMSFGAGSDLGISSGEWR